MKRLFSHIKLTTLSLLLFSACSQDDVMKDKTSDAVTEDFLRIGSVSVTDFVSENGSRATNDGITVTFANDDRLGVLLIDETGEAFTNAPFRYDGNQWNNENSVFYSGNIASAIAYFPYTADIGNTLPSSIDELKKIFIHKETFAEKDLLVSEISEFDDGLMRIDFTHAFSMISFSAENTVKSANNNDVTYLLGLSNVSFSIGDISYTPELMNNRYVSLVDEESLSQNGFRYFYTVNDESYAKTIATENIILEANKSYSFPCPVTQETSGIASGDFYCISSADDDVVILPGTAAVIPDGWTCKGIVFYTMDSSAFSTYASTNELTADDYPGYNGNHGLVVSLSDGGALGTAESFEKFLLTSVTDWDSKTVLNGYKMTKAMQEAVTNNTIQSFTALNNHDESVSSSATSWFAPSFMELAILVRGDDGNTVSSNGRTRINRQLQKVGGTDVAEGNIPSITFESQTSPQQQNVVWFVTGSSGDEYSYPFADAVPGETYRPICAF